MKSDRTLGAILLLGAAVRLYGLGERSLSYDECQQFWAAQGNPLISNRRITLDPPLFAGLLHVHSQFGNGEAWLRLLPCLIGILAIPAVYRLARAATESVGVARVAAFFAAVAPYPIRYSQSLRVYSLTLVLCALLPAAFLEARRENRFSSWTITALLLAAALLTMYGAVWILGGMILLLLAGALRTGIGSARRGLLALAAGSVGALPFYWFSLPAQMREGTPATFYDDKFLPGGGVWPALRFLGQGTLDLSSYLSFIHPAAGALFGLLALLGIGALRRHPAGRPAAALFAAGVIAAAAASTLRLYPYGGTRQMLFVAPLYYVAAAAGIESLRERGWRWIHAGALGAMALGCGIFLYRYHTEPGGQEMRPVTRYLESRLGEEDRILINKDAIPQFRFYYRGKPTGIVWGRETVIRDYLSEANRILASDPSARWWLVFSHGWSDGRRGELAAIDPRFAMTDRFEAHQAAVYLFTPAPGTGTKAPPGGIPR